MKEDLEGNIEELKNYLNKLDESGLYDAEKYSRSLLHQTSQLSYFYCKDIDYCINRSCTKVGSVVWWYKYYDSGI